MGSQANIVDRQEQLSGRSAVEKVRMLLKDFRSALFTTAMRDGFHTRPMGLLGKASEFAGSLWFFTDTRSTTLHEIEAGAKTSLLFQSDNDSIYLQLSGRAAEMVDRAKMKELYTPLIRTWFPEGLDDPHLTLVRFDAEHGRFWESPGGVAQSLGAFAKAVLTGEPSGSAIMGELDLR